MAPSLDDSHGRGVEINRPKPFELFEFQNVERFVIANLGSQFQTKNSRKFEFIKFIMKTCPCNIQRVFFCGKFHWEKRRCFFFFFFFFFFLNGEAVLTSTHSVCFGSKTRKLDIPLQTPVFLYTSGV